MFAYESRTAKTCLFCGTTCRIRQVTRTKRNSGLRRWACDPAAALICGCGVWLRYPGGLSGWIRNRLQVCRRKWTGRSNWVSHLKPTSLARIRGRAVGKKSLKLERSHRRRDGDGEDHPTVSVSSAGVLPHPPGASHRFRQHLEAAMDSAVAAYLVWFLKRITT
jgi:hypothetical protein